jgi:hypothetical protein
MEMFIAWVMLLVFGGMFAAMIIGWIANEMNKSQQLKDGTSLPPWHEPFPGQTFCSRCHKSYDAVMRSKKIPHLCASCDVITRRQIHGG